MGFRVLIADDDRALLSSLSIRLKSEGYEVFCAQDSYQAVDQARKVWPDVLVLDINMPAGNGFSVQDRVHHMDLLKDIPVVYVTGDRSEAVAELATTHQAAAIVYKPFETKTLLEAIKYALSPHASLRQPVA